MCATCWCVATIVASGSVPVAFAVVVASVVSLHVVVPVAAPVAIQVVAAICRRNTC